MPNTITRSSKNSPLLAQETEQIILLLEENRQSLIDEWVEAVRIEFKQPESTTDTQLADHMLYILDALIAEMKLFQSDPSRSKSYRQGDMRYDFGTIDDDKEGGDKHGRQRASINAYNADKVFWEYVLLRKIVVQFLQERRLLDIDHLEIITCVIESCSRDSLTTFSATIQNVQRKLLGTIVHDIRNPLNSISLMAEHISMMGKNDKSAEFADRIVAISGRIAGMLEDMLSTLAAEAGQGLDLSFQQHNLNGILSSLQADYQATYGFRLKLNLPTQTVMGVFDRQMIIRVMENLISNAFKYGDIATDVTLTVVETDSSFILNVHNFGEPIDKNRYVDIFQFFKLFEGQERLEKRSWGIGLAFVKAITEGHQGHVSVSSDATEGTRFSVNIPKSAFQHGDTKTVTI